MLNYRRKEFESIKMSDSFRNKWIKELIIFCPNINFLISQKMPPFKLLSNIKQRSPFVKRWHFQIINYWNFQIL